jgi:hypothetical protein
VGTATGRGACNPDQRPFVEPATLNIPLTRVIGELTFRDAQNKCIQWYAIQIPDWIILEAQDYSNSREGVVKEVQIERGEGAQRNQALWFTTQENGVSIITVRPDWNAIRTGTMTEGQVILRDDDKARRVVITVKVGADRRSLTLEVQNPT